MLVKKESALAWELRTLLWSRSEVVIALRRGATVPRYRGYVVRVSPTDAFASIDDARWNEPVEIQLGLVLSVRRPHFHEDGPEPERDRPIFEPDRGPDPMPGQLVGGGTPPPVSPRTRLAMAKAAGMLLSQPLLDVLGALDSAVRGKESVPTAAIADAAGETIQGTVRLLRSLAERDLVAIVAERPYAWTPR